MTTLADLFPDYPAPDDPDLQRKVAELYEFAQLASRTDEPTPGRAEFYRHQLFVMRWLREYDQLFLIDEPGTGKTGAIQAYTEHARREHLRDPHAPIRRALVLVPGSISKAEFRVQLICKSNLGEFEARQAVRAPSTPRSRSSTRSRITGSSRTAWRRRATTRWLATTATR